MSKYVYLRYILFFGEKIKIYIYTHIYLGIHISLDHVT